MSIFKKAVKSQSKLRLMLDGASGSGKTYSALLLASAFSDKVVVIDTEHGSASLYSALFRPFPSGACFIFSTIYIYPCHHLS